MFSASADKSVKMMDLNTGQVQQVAGHDAPIRCVESVDGTAGLQNCIVTGSWDKSIRYWDLRASSPVATVQMSERVSCMDVKYPLLVVGTADRKIQIINLNNPSVVYKSVDSPLKWQTRVYSFSMC